MNTRDGGFSDSVLLLVVVPLMLAVAAGCAQVTVVTYAWARADLAAQAGADAMRAGVDPEPVALGSLSSRLLEGAVVEVRDGEVVVEVRSGSILPRFPESVVVGSSRRLSS